MGILVNSAFLPTIRKNQHSYHKEVLIAAGEAPG